MKYVVIDRGGIIFLVLFCVMLVGIVGYLVVDKVVIPEVENETILFGDFMDVYNTRTVFGPDMDTVFMMDSKTGEIYYFVVYYHVRAVTALGNPIGSGDPGGPPDSTKVFYDYGVPGEDVDSITYTHYFERVDSAYEVGPDGWTNGMLERDCWIRVDTVDDRIYHCRYQPEII